MDYTSREVYEYISRKTHDPIMERKICTISWTEFPIFQSDVDFYDKISPTFAGQKFQIPTPTLCPEERQRRRLSFNNERNLYKRKCDASGDSIISVYSPDKIYKVYGHKYRRSDNWDPLSYGCDFDVNKTFSQQFDTLNTLVPKMSIFVDSNENSDYANMAWWNKNCYLISNSDHNEDCYYTQDTYYSKYAVDCLFSYRMEIAYACIDCEACFETFFCIECQNSQSLSFCKRCANCNNCFWCVGLRSAHYCIFNKSYTKEEYDRQVKSMRKYSLWEIEDKVKILSLSFSLKGTSGYGTTATYWNCISNSKNSFLCFDSIDLEDCKYCTNLKGAKDCQDLTRRGHPWQICYESTWTWEWVDRILFCHNSRWNSSNLYYCSNCVYSTNLFWCIWLRNKSYCILNKQYTKEEYELTVAQIITHMRSWATSGWQEGWLWWQGERWEFFHPSLSPFGYNETVANEHFPLTRTEALARWYKRQDNNYDPIIPEGAKVLRWDDMPWDIATVTDDILKSIFICEISGRPFRIIKQELEFYRTHHLPLPRKHPDVRHEERMKLRPWRTLHVRTCDKCGQEMLSVYDRKYSWKVYCEECYQKEIYA
jgi:hypothetical protein